MAGLQLIHKRYQLADEIGTGGMGTVYRGIDQETGETVAIKRLKSEAIASDPGMIERFAREAEALRQLNHPNIVKVLETLQDNGSHYLVMEYVPGGDLRQVLKAQSPLPAGRVLSIAIELADALTRAHYLKIIHRDLKPANVLLAADGTPRLTDFGVAHFVSKERVTGTGMAVGTPDYLAPEALNGEAVDPRTDIWSFGVMLFEMLTGRRPFEGDHIAQIVTAILTEPIPDLEALRPDCPVELVDLVYRMLDKDRTARIPSVRLVGAELEAIIQGVELDTSRIMSPRLVEDHRFQTPTPATKEVKHNLPMQTTPFVGREAEIAEIIGLVNDPTVRIITILAPGGMGKTRLGLEVAARFVGTPASLQTAFWNGIFFIELAPLQMASDIIPAIAEAVGCQFQQEERDHRQQLLDYLREKSMLLVLDNFEHLIDGAGIVTDMIQAAPSVQIIATSRQRLNQSGETLFHLGGLDVPGADRDAQDYSAVKLFVQSARRARPGFVLQPDDIPHVTRICRLVDGLPLGIVLAASWLELLTLHELADEIAQSVDFLETQMTDIPERQRSIRAVFDYSWNLMKDAEQRVFMMLSIFRGGFMREAAQAVTGANLPMLMSLLNKSLIRRNPDTGRFDIHELLRQYAEEKLESSGEANAARRAHSAYFADFIASREKDLLSASQVKTLQELEIETQNIRCALWWTSEQGEVTYIDKLLPAFMEYFYVTGRFQEAAQILQELEDLLKKGGLPDDHLTLWRIRCGQAFMLAGSGHYQAGYDLAAQSLSIFESLNSRREISLAYLTLGYVAMMRGEIEQALDAGEKAVHIANEVGFQWGLIAGVANIGYAHFLAGNYAEAKHIYREQVAKAERGDLPPAVGAYMFNNLGEIHHALSEEKDARRLFEKALTTFRQINNKYGMAFTLNNLGKVAHAVADFEEAKHYNQQALDLSRETGDRRSIADALNRLGGVAYTLAEYQQAYAYHQEALQIYQEMGDKRGVANSLMQLGIALNPLGQYDQSIAYFQEALALRRELGNPLDISDSLNLLALTHSFMEDFDQAFRYVEAGEAELREFQVNEPGANMQNEVIRLFVVIQAGRHDLAEPILERVTPIVENAGLRWWLPQLRMAASYVHIAHKHYGEARQSLEQCIEISLKIRTIDFAVFGLILLAEVFAIEGNPEDAAACLVFLIDYPVAHVFMRNQAKRYLDSIRLQLTPEAYAAAVERGKTLDLDAVINILLRGA